jgi:integrase
MAKMLTDAAVKKYRSSGKRRAIRDAGARSLYLVVEASGSKTWMMRFRRPGGRAGKMVLGPLHAEAEPPGEVTIGMPLTLKGARLLAAQVHRERSQGRDPIADHKARKRRHRSAASDTYAALVKEFVIDQTSKLRHWQTPARHLGIDPETLEPIPDSLCERWADRDLRSIHPQEIYDLVDEVRRIGVPGTDSRMDKSDSRVRAFRSNLSKFFSWSRDHRKVDANPVSGVLKLKPPSRDRVLGNDELVKLWKASDAIHPAAGAAIKLLMLTGCRLNEIRELRWAEVGDAQIDLPGTRTKNHRAHVVPLSGLAQEILASVERIDGSPYAFTVRGTVPVEIGSKMKRRLDALTGIADWRIHDIRRSVVTGMATLNIRPDVIELIVNHVSGFRAGVAGIYNKSEMLPERRAALERWSQHVAGLVAERPANVAPIRPRKSGS